MDFKTLQGYDEKFARVTVKPHKTFDGKVIEVLYGAVDENGQPVYPKSPGENGCGRWVGIESGDKTTMFIWQHPKSEGGAIEYGTEDKEKALEVMEDAIREKMALCKNIDAVANEGNLSAKDTFDELTKTFENMKDWETAKEAELKERIAKAKERFETKVNRINDRVSQKEGLLEEAKKLVDSNKWKETRKAFEELHDEWNDIGNAGEKESELWKQFNNLRREFDNKRRDYFKNLDENRNIAVKKKEELIASAKEIVSNNSNFKAAADKMNKLMDDWKAAGYAGKEKGDELWEEFNGIRKKFFDDKKEYFANLEEQYKEAIAKKEELINRANDITQTAEYSKENTEAMMAIDKEWKEVGFAGYKKNDELWKKLKAIKDVFWDGKRADSQKRFKERLEKKNELINSQREQLNKLQEDVYATDDFDIIHDLERQIERKKDFIEQLKGEIADLEKRINPEEEVEEVKAVVEEPKADMDEVVEDLEETAEELEEAEDEEDEAEDLDEKEDDSDDESDEDDDADDSDEEEDDKED